MEILNRIGSSTDPWGYLTSNWPPVQLCAADHNPLCPAFDPSFNPPYCPFNLSLFHSLSKDSE